MEYLDQKRLGKQRIEAAQILEILLQKPILPKSLQSIVPVDFTTLIWKSHPAVLMWAEHEQWLLSYLDVCIGEWCNRGYLNNIVVPEYDQSSQDPPKWLGHGPFHRSHRSNLLRKFPAHYRQFWPGERDDLAYWWPTDFPEFSGEEAKQGEK